MKNIVIIFLGLLISHSLYSQINVKATPLPTGDAKLVNTPTNTFSNNIACQEVESFVNGFAKVYSGSFWTFIDINNIQIATAQFEAVRNFKGNVAAVKKNNKWGFIDENGNTLISFIYDIVFDFNEEVTVAYKDKKWYLIKKDAAIIKELDVDVFYGFKNKIADILKNGRTGKLDINGNIISLATAPTQNILSANLNYRNAASPLSAPCPTNIDFEMGNFTNWNCFTGTTSASGTTNVITVSASPPTATRHEIYSSMPAIDPYGLFSTVSPNGSGYALKLGNNINGSKAERVTYQLTIPAGVTDASITYRYAVVFQDPGHFTYQQPRFSAKLRDVATNTFLPCASYEYIANSTLPGFFNSPLDDSVKCKAWASVFINLSAYAGKTLNLEFTTADCTRGAHWGYAYVDVGDCNIAANIQYQCNTNVATGSAPPGFEYYNWWNNNYTSILATGQNATISPIPAFNSTLHVEVIPFNGYGCKDTLDVLITNSYVNADAGLDKNYCTGGSATIGASAVSGNIYSWSPASSLSNSTISNPTANPLVSTTYYLTVTNPANSCSKIDTVNVFVNPKPISAFTAPANQCISNNNFTFNNNSTGAATYFWQFGDGATSTLQNPTHTYTTAANYTVKLIVVNSTGCMDSLTQNITVFAKPNAAFTAPANQCISNNNFTFNNTSTGAATYLWQFGDGATSTLQYPTHTYTTAANYTVKLIVVNSSGCKDSLTQNITVFAKPTPAFTAPANQCISNNNFTFNNTSTGAATYLWQFGDDTTSTLQNPTHTYATAANYTIKLIVANSTGCMDSVMHNVSFWTKPLADFISPADQCLPNNNFNFSNTSSGAASYNWSFGDGNNSTVANPTHIYNSTSQYVVKLFVTNDNGCVDSASHTLNVNALPTITTQKFYNICAGNSIQLAASGAQTYQWSPTQGLSCSTCANPILIATNNINYTVNATSNVGCSASEIINITVIQPIQIQVDTVNPVCSKSSVNLLATGANSYVWSPAHGLSNTQISNPIASPDTTTNYMVIGKDLHNCFVDTGYVKVKVLPAPTVNLGVDVTLTTGTIYQLIANTGNSNVISWLWTPATNLSCTKCQFPLATVKFDITYQVLVKNIFGCTAVDLINIHTLCKGSQVYVPNAFTPDGDGKNDILMVRSKGVDMVRSLKIYSRWGELIFEKQNFPPNNPAYGWDGKINGKTGSAEVYVYILDVTCDNNEKLTFKGNISILK